MLDGGTEQTGPSMLVTTIPTMYDWNLNSPTLFVVDDGYGTRLCASDPAVDLLARCCCMLLECFPIRNHVIEVQVAMAVLEVDTLLLLVD